MINQKSPVGTLPMGTIVKTADGVIGVVCGRPQHIHIPLYTSDSSMVNNEGANTDIVGEKWIPTAAYVEVLYTPYEAALAAFELMYKNDLFDEGATNGE